VLKIDENVGARKQIWCQEKPVEASIFLSALVFNCYGAIIRLKKSFSDSCQNSIFNFKQFLGVLRPPNVTRVHFCRKIT
jgi:hypothetical protein